MAQYEIRPIEHLAILGLGTSCYQWVAATYDHMPECEIWTINAGAYVFRHDVVFDMHTAKYLENHKKTSKESNLQRIDRRREWLKTHNKPIIMAQADPDIPNSLTYPLKKVVEGTNSCYFATGVAYMLALAYMAKVKKLGLFGVDFSYDRDKQTHYEVGQRCCEYWLGRLLERGCSIELPNDTHLLDMKHRTTKGTIYGYDEPLEFEFPIGGGMGKFIGPDYAD